MTTVPIVGPLVALATLVVLSCLISVVALVIAGLETGLTLLPGLALLLLTELAPTVLSYAFWSANEVLTFFLVAALQLFDDAPGLPVALAALALLSLLPCGNTIRLRALPVK